jgi:peroxiredoxin
MAIHPRKIALTVSGIGFILLVIALTLFIPTWRRVMDAMLPTDFAAIPTRVQYAAPVLSLMDIHGNMHSLSDYRGEVVLVNLWATWCPPCKAEMPELQNYYSLHKQAGLTVIAVDDGEPTPDILSFAAQYRLTFPLWLDPTYQAAEHAFRAVNLPSSYVIDRTGQVIWVWVGAISRSNLEKFITPILQN